MTIQEFLDALEQTPREWTFVEGDLIRCPWGCPLDVVPGAREHMDWRDVLCVQDAADSRYYTLGPELRAQLLQRTGLAEPEAKA